MSALELAARAGQVLGRLARALPLALDEPGIQIPSVDVEGRCGRAAAALDADAVVATLTNVCETLATTADGTPWEAWDRMFSAGDEEHPAVWIVQHAAVVGSQHLRDIERVGRLVGARDDED